MPRCDEIHWDMKFGLSSHVLQKTVHFGDIYANLLQFSWIFCFAREAALLLSSKCRLQSGLPLSEF